MKVRARKTGYYDDALRRVGDVFTLLDPTHFSARWMTTVDPATPEQHTSANQAIDQTRGEPIARPSERPQVDDTNHVLHDGDPYRADGFDPY